MANHMSPELTMHHLVATEDEKLSLTAEQAADSRSPRRTLALYDVHL